MKNFILSIILLLILPSYLYAACQEYPSESGNWYPGSYASQSLAVSDINDCVDSAGAGDTIHLKAGTVTNWDNDVSLDKSVNLIGAGMNSTNIEYDGNGSDNFIIVSADNVRISGIHLKATGEGVNNYIYVGGDRESIRIDHNKFTNNPYGGYRETGVAIEFRWSDSDGHPYNCLVDNNEFYDTRLVNNSSNTSRYHSFFAETDVLGTQKMLVIENNTFDRSNATGTVNGTDASRGGSNVSRYNTYINCQYFHHPTDGVDADNRGSRYWEVYGNDFYATNGYWLHPIRLRGGTGMVFDNESITDTRSDDNYILMDTQYQRHGDCDGYSDVDGNLGGSYPAGYWCRDQIGRATDAFEFTTLSNVPTQASEPAYLWDNEYPVGIYAGDGDYIDQNRDYYEDDDSNMQSGTWANRPGTCDEGDGFWATDLGTWNTTGADGQLYVCDGSNTWVFEYEPYTYPHPLVSGEGDTTPPTVSGSPTIGTDGTTLTIGLSETVTRSGGTFDVDCTTAGTNITATYSSGSGSSSLVYTLGTEVFENDTCNLDYDGEADGIEDAAGNDLDLFSDTSISNNSTQTPPGESNCSNGLDDDEDTFIDCLDSDCDGVGDCEYGTELSCIDLIDNDGDTFIDCLDSDCSADLYCIDAGVKGQYNSNGPAAIYFTGGSNMVVP